MCQRELLKPSLPESKQILTEEGRLSCVSRRAGPHRTVPGRGKGFSRRKAARSGMAASSACVAREALLAQRPILPVLRQRAFIHRERKKRQKWGIPQAEEGAPPSCCPPKKTHPKGLRTASKEERARTQARTAVRLGALTVPQKAAPDEDIITREGQVVLESRRWDGGQGSESQTVPHDRRRRLARVEHRARS